MRTLADRSAANIEMAETRDCRSYSTAAASRSPTIPGSEVGYKTPRMLSSSGFVTHLMSAFNSTILSSVAGEDNQLVTGAIGAAAILVTTAAYYALRSKHDEHEFPKLRGIQLYHAWNFFQRRFDFLQSNFDRSFGRSFSFKVLHHTVVALAGEEARQAFFSDQHLGFNEGYTILMGAVRVSPYW